MITHIDFRASNGLIEIFINLLRLLIPDDKEVCSRQ